MLKTKGKVFGTVVIVLLLIPLIWLAVETTLSFRSDLPLWVNIVIGVLGYSMVLCLASIDLYGLWYLWEKIPTITKKDEDQLKKWLDDRHYSLWNGNLYLISDKRVRYVFDTKGVMKKGGEATQDGWLEIHSSDGVHKYSIPNGQEKALGNHWKYFQCDDQFLLLFFNNEPSRMLVYEKKDS